MANLIKLAPGQISNYTSCGFITTDFQSLANNAVAIQPVGQAIPNDVNCDDYIDVSYRLWFSVSSAINTFIALYILPLNGEGVYGDGTVTGTTLPGSSYWVTNGFPRSGITAGNNIDGVFPTVMMPRAAFLLGIANFTGAIFNATQTNLSIKYKTSVLTGNG